MITHFISTSIILEYKNMSGKSYWSIPTRKALGRQHTYAICKAAPDE